MSAPATTGVDRHAYLDTAPLKPGDTVRFVSPSGLGSKESLERAVAFYEAWGLNVVVGEHVLDPHPRASYLAGPDEGRRADLVQAWCDPDADAIVCIRGGYGAMRLLDGIDWELMRANALRRDGRPKLLTGSSDITALHEAFRFHLDVPTLFCPMAGNDVFNEATTVRPDVQRWLMEPWRDREIIGAATEVMVPGQASGRFTGGNLSLMSAAVGAVESAVPQGALCFLEDIDEDIYRLDNLLLQLQRFGRLDAASGFVLGSWFRCGEPEAIRALMEEYLGHLGVPVLWEQGFGHDPEALSIPLNVDGVLVAPAQGAPRLTVGAGEFLVPDAGAGSAGGRG